MSAMNTPFKPRTFSKTLTLLCELHGEPYYKKGKVVQAAIKAKTGIDQSIISRWLNNPDRIPDAPNVKKLAKLFKVSPAQMRGEQPIETLDGKTQLSEDDLNFLELYKRLPEHIRHTLREQGKTYDTLLKERDTQHPES